MQHSRDGGAGGAECTKTILDHNNANILADVLDMFNTPFPKDEDIFYIALLYRVCVLRI